MYQIFWWILFKILKKSLKNSLPSDNCGFDRQTGSHAGAAGADKPENILYQNFYILYQNFYILYQNVYILYQNFYIIYQNLFLSQIWRFIFN